MIFSAHTSLATHIGFAAVSALCGSSDRHPHRSRTVLVSKREKANGQFSQENSVGAAITLTAEAAKHLLSAKQGALSAILRAAL